MELKVRPSIADDFNFIYATWLRGLYYGSEFYGSIDKEAFFKNYEKVIKQLLARTDIKINIACLEDTPDVILGWAVLGPTDTLHYVFVKEAWRRQGLTASLVIDCSEIRSVTHITKLGNTIRIKKKLVFNPFLI